MKVQFQGVAMAPGNTDFKRSYLKQVINYAILKPALAWEGDCVEGTALYDRIN